MATEVVIPLQGTPGVRDGRNPTLLPNFDTPVANSPNGVASTVALNSPASFNLANQRAAATVTATIGGSVTTSDELTIEITSGALAFNGGIISHTITAGGSDTVATLAEAFAKAFNDDPAAQQVSLETDAVAGVITFNWPGPVGNLAVATAPTLEEAKITIGGIALTGDKIVAVFTGPAIGPNPLPVSISPTTGNSTTVMAAALAAAISANSTLIGLGISATNSSAVVNLVVPAAAEPLVLTAFVNTVAPTAVIGGTVTPGDVVSLIVTAANLPVSPQTISHTSILGDATATIAAALAAAFQADPVLQAAGFTAVASSSTITITEPTALGQIRYTSNVTGSATESVTLPATPTETATVSTSATETITFGNSGLFAGGSGPIYAYNNFQEAYGGSILNFRYGEPEFVDPPLLAQLISEGQPIL